MKNFEDELREALARQEPPLGFARRVLRRVPAQTLEARRPRVLVWAAAAGIVLAVAGGIQNAKVQRAREERIKGEAAAEQVLEALRFTAGKLQMVQARVKEIGS